jgi:hemerythrin-like domain-containing protein
VKRHITATSRSDCLAPTDPVLLGNPLDFIAEDHLRERQICALIDRIANAGEVDVPDVENVLSFLGEELQTHLEDEEQDLFPMMRSRCEAEDEIDKVIDRLRSDHSRVEALMPKVKAALGRLLARGSAPGARDRAALTDFASHARRHLIVENAIILPIARARLGKTDLDRLRLGMLRRRGLDRVLEDKDADRSS